MMLALPFSASSSFYWTFSRKLGQTKSNCGNTPCPRGQQVLQGSISSNRLDERRKRKKHPRRRRKKPTPDTENVTAVNYSTVYILRLKLVQVCSGRDERHHWSSNRRRTGDTEDFSPRTAAVAAAAVAGAHLIEVMCHFSDAVRSDRLTAVKTVKPKNKDSVLFHAQTGSPVSLPEVA